MTDSLPEGQSKSGLILKAAREEMSLTLEQVANELHLRPSVVRAIENENYDEFTSDVFLKGYFRTYCRLVNLHEVRMMQLLDQQLLTRQQRVEQKQNLEHKQVIAKKRKKIFITVGVFLVCLFLIAITYKIVSQGFGNSDLKSQNNQQDLSVDSESTSNIPSNNTLTAEDSLDEEINTNSDAELEPSDSLELEQKTTSENQDTETDQELTEQINDNAVIEESNTTEEPPLQDSVTTELAVQATIKAIFSGDCWFKVTDVEGKNVIADLKKTDEEISFTGSAPFHVVIGDASKVSLVFEDKAVNLKPYTSRNGRAELTLRPSGSDNEG